MFRFQVISYTHYFGFERPREFLQKLVLLISTVPPKNKPATHDYIHCNTSIVSVVHVAQAASAAQVFVWPMVASGVFLQPVAGASGVAVIGLRRPVCFVCRLIAHRRVHGGSFFLM